MSPTLPQITTEVWEFPVTGGLVLAAPNLEGLVLLNPTAAGIWEQFRQGEDPDQIANNLTKAYGIPKEQAERDVNATLDQWTEIFSRKPSPPKPLPPLPSKSDLVITCQYNGKTFSISSDSIALDAEIRPRVLALQIPNQMSPDFTFHLSTGLNGEIHLHCDAEFIATEPNVSAARAILLQEIVRRCAESPREWLALLHAGACGNDHSCVIFPAASHSGKTTLAAVLMQSGLTFYADDSVALEKETLKTPTMPFGLAIREGSWPLMARRVEGFSRLDVTQRFGQEVRFINPPVHGRLALASAIVFSSYRMNNEAKIHPITTFEALIQIKQSGFWLDNTRESTGRFVTWLESVPCYQLTYEHVDEAFRIISALI